MVVVDSAVESLETKSPLYTTGRYAKAEHGGVMGSKLISDLQGLVEAILSPGHAERAAAAKRKEAGVVQFTGESRDDVSAEAVAVERSGARRPRRRGFASDACLALRGA